MPIPIPIAAAGVSALGGIASQFIASRQQNRNVRRTNRANLRLANLKYDRDMEMAQFGYDKDLEMWHLQNQYNSPAAQMQRFEDAGLNKHMIYGQGTPGNATGMPRFIPPSFQPPTQDFMAIQSPGANVLGQFTGASKDLLQIQQMDKDLERKTYEARMADWTQQIQSMNIPGANLKYLTDRLKAEEFVNIPHSQKSQWIRKEIKASLTDSQVKQLGQKLNNQYQSEVNALAKQGMTLGDKIYLRIGAQILNALGYDVSTVTNQINN